MKKEVKNDDIVAVLSYVIIGIVWYFVDDKMKKSSFAGFHVRQALNLWIISICIQIVLSILIFVGWLIMPFVGLLIFVLWLMGIINAINGKKTKLPLIGKFADRYLKF